MAWHDYREARRDERATKLDIPKGELRVNPLRWIGWFFGWLAFYTPQTVLYQFLRMLEVPVIIVALIAFWVDFIVDRPADRVIRAWTVIAQSRLAEGNIGQGTALTMLIKAGEDIRGINLSKAWLVEADLSGADLSDATIIYARLSRADLSGAFLAGTNFVGADLSGVNFVGANLSGADLSGANFSGANLSGANLSVVRLPRSKFTLACADPKNPPKNLPAGVEPPKRWPCPEVTRN